MARQYGTPPETPQEKAQLDKYGRSRRDPEPKTRQEDPSPPNQVVELFHKNASIDTQGSDIHHTLGISPNQAAKGSHDHSGGPNGKLILEGYTLTGSKASPSTVLPSIIAALVRLGAKDSTT